MASRLEPGFFIALKLVITPDSPPSVPVDHESLQCYYWLVCHYYAIFRSPFFFHRPPKGSRMNIIDLSSPELSYIEGSGNNISLKAKCILFLLISVLIIGGCGTSAMTAAQKDMANQIDQLLTKRNFSGSILVVNNGRIILDKGYGLANLEDKTANEPDTVFRLGSITKQFTAAAILLLEERGALTVDDPLSRYIPDYPNGDKITIHNLLTHTSGIPEYLQYVDQSDDYPYTPAELIDLFKHEPLSFNPGEKFTYSNSNYILLGYIIEQVSQMTYEEFMKENIFKPLGMDHTGYGSNGYSAGKAVGYENMQEGRESPYVNMAIPYAAGALESITRDLYKWLQALNGATLLTRESLDKMFTPYLGNYGYGWVFDLFYKNEMSHSGRINGFSTYIYRDTERDNALIILSNKALASMTMLSEKILPILKAGGER